MSYSELAKLISSLGQFLIGLSAMITTLKSIKKEPKQKRRARKFK